MTTRKWPQLGIRAEASEAWAALCRTLDAGPPVPCSTDPTAWTSEHTADRTEAAAACDWCHARNACRTFGTANAEVASVWGGTDLTPQPTRGVARARRRP